MRSPVHVRLTSRLRAALIAIPVALVGLVAAPGTLPAHAATRDSGSSAPYYLSLGDSLAQGVQPNRQGVSVETRQGYADDLYFLQRFQIRGLRLEKLGCPGETTTSMINGGICTYAAGSQLAEAVAFLKTHDVALITIDIGANDIDSCATGTTVNPVCLGDGFHAVETNLPVILTALRSAAPAVPLVAMNYYDPFLAAWLEGTSEAQAFAKASVALGNTFNQSILGAIYAAFKVPVADVASAFQTSNFTVLPFVNLPENVAVICALTWMCAPPPVGPNIHANFLGYWVIAWTFEQTIRGLPASS